MEPHIYSEVELRRLKGQAVKDIWHAMIGKPPGLKNTTGLKSGEEVIQAILQMQDDPLLLRTPKPLLSKPVKEKEMPPRKKPGPKPKLPPPPPPPVSVPGKLRAVETMDPPLSISTVTRICVHKLCVKDTWYYLDSKTQTVYECLENRPGERLGVWNPETKTLQI